MSRYVPPSLRQRVRDHFAGQCAYCRTSERLCVATFEVEHIVPRTSGGPTTADNLCLACPTCNRFKASHLSAIDPETGEVVPLFHPHLNDWHEHFAWNPDATRLTGLTPIARATIELLRINRPAMLRLRALWRSMNEHPQQD